MGLAQWSDILPAMMPPTWIRSLLGLAAIALSSCSTDRNADSPASLLPATRAVASTATGPATEPVEARITAGPWLQAPTATSVTLVWTTSVPCVSRVSFGTSPQELAETAVSAHHGLLDANATLHRVTLSGLKPGTRYYYRVESRHMMEFKPYKTTYGATLQSETQSFATLDPVKERFSFVILNDRHEKAQGMRQALASIRWEGVDLVFGNGDMLNDADGEKRVINNLVNPVVEAFASRIPFVFVRGNHETRGAFARSHLDYFPTPTGKFYYSFDHGPVHFLILDGGEDKPDASEEYSGLNAFEPYMLAQTEWLKNELASETFRKAGYRVCLLHIPPGDHDKDPVKWMKQTWLRKNWNPLLNAAGLDVMFSGHTHKYEEVPPGKADNAFPIVIGGIDTVIRVDVGPERLEITTCNNDGSVKSRPAPVARKDR